MTDTRCALYRHFDAFGVLLYVESTTDPAKEWELHVKHSRWARFVSRTEMDWYPTQAEAKSAKAAAIRTGRPVFNQRRGEEHKLRSAEYLRWNAKRPLVSVRKFGDMPPLGAVAAGDAKSAQSWAVDACGSHGYRQGCRCEACEKTRRKRLASREARRDDSRATPVRIDIHRHGTLTGYRDGCRCGKCLRAARVYLVYCARLVAAVADERLTPKSATQKSSGVCGTLAGYDRGCRCEECMRFHRRHRRASRLASMAPDDARHGIPSGYRDGCRCDKCKAASRSGNAACAARWLLTMTKDDHRHGTRTGYSYGCRCNRCKAAARRTGKAQRMRSARVHSQ